MDTRPECASTKPASSTVTFFPVLREIMTEGRSVDKKKGSGWTKKGGGWTKKGIWVDNIKEVGG